MLSVSHTRRRRITHNCDQSRLALPPAHQQRMPPSTCGMKMNSNSLLGRITALARRSLLLQMEQHGLSVGRSVGLSRL